MQDLLDLVIFESSLLRWAIATVVAVATIAVLTVVKRVAIARLATMTARTATRFDDVVVEALQGTRNLTIVAVGIAAGARTLSLPAEADLWLGRGVIVVLALQAGLWVTRGVKLALERPADPSAPPGQRTMGAALGFLTNLLVWSVLVLVVLSNFGVEVSTLVAGLGVGGIAAALAVQNVLGDLFAAFSLYIDRPFDLGDFVIVDSYLGTVEKIGWRSTHLRSLSGELIVLANSDLAEARIRNYKRMHERRVVVHFGVAYGTPADKLEAIPAMVRETLSGIEGVRFDRSHLAKLGESALEFETVFYVLEPDYGVFMDRQQKLLFALYRRFEQEGLRFSLPTRRLVQWADAAP